MAVDALLQRMVAIIATISVEPVMLLDGLAYSTMVVLVENLQMDKICYVNLNFSDEVCENLSNYTSAKNEQQKEVSIFNMYNGIIMSTIPLFFILFIGAWSDKYGRKVPLCLSLVGHVLYSAGYLINSWVWHWPVEYLLAVALLDSLGGGTVAFLTASNSYISDVTSEEARTSRVGFANSIWFLGGPLGTLIGTYIYKSGGYQVLFGTSLTMYLIALLYTIMLLPESHGPFADKERLQKIVAPKPTIRLRDSIIRVYGISKKVKASPGVMSQAAKRKERITIRRMILDFFNPKRLIDSCRCTLKKREGLIRAYILLLIFCNLLRKLGRGAYMYLFTRHVLYWEAADYGIWVTYKNFISTMGSLVAVPLLSAGLHVSDNILAMVGALSSVIDYVLYGLVSEDTYFFIWLAPAAALLVNSCAIAIRAMISKYVSPDELGKVSAVLGALDGVMPMVSFCLYTAVYHASVAVFPGSQFFFGAGTNVLMALIFIVIMMTDRTSSYDVEKATPDLHNNPITEKKLVLRKDSRWLFDEEHNNKLRISTIILSALNFSIEALDIERTYSKKKKPLDGIKENDETETLETVGDVEQKNTNGGNVNQNDIGERAKISGANPVLESTGRKSSGITNGYLPSSNSGYDNEAFVSEEK